MATYLAHNAKRDTVTLMLTRAEAEALLAAIDFAEVATDDEGTLMEMNGQTRAAYKRAVSALNASTNTSARRAGFFDV